MNLHLPICKSNIHKMSINLTFLRIPIIRRGSDIFSHVFGGLFDMGWLWLVGSITLYVSFAKEPYIRDNILPKRPIISSILLTKATPYILQRTHAWQCMKKYLWNGCNAAFWRIHISRRGNCVFSQVFGGLFDICFEGIAPGTVCNCTYEMAVRLTFGKFTSVGEEVVYLARYFVDFLIEEAKDPRVALLHFGQMELDRVRSPETFALSPMYIFMMLEVTHCNALQRTATHCYTLQHTAAHCNKLQHTATHCNTL